MKKGNLFTEFHHSTDEYIEILKSDSNVRIERIVSEGQISPPGFWYDQDEWEYVIVLQGSAEIETLSEKINMNAGDWIIISEHERHKVTYTSKEPPCVWLAVFGRSKS